MKLVLLASVAAIALAVGPVDFTSTTFPAQASLFDLVSKKAGLARPNFCAQEKAILDFTPEAVAFPQDNKGFHFVTELEGKVNPNAYDFANQVFAINSLIAQPNQKEGKLTESFMNIFNEIQYELSAEEKTRLQTTLTNSRPIADQCVAKYESVFGTISQQQIIAARQQVPYVQSKLDYVVNYQILTQWSCQNNAPITVDSLSKFNTLNFECATRAPMTVINECSNYMQEINTALPLSASLVKTDKDLWALEQNLATPKVNNGGIQVYNQFEEIVNPAIEFVPSNGIAGVQTELQSMDHQVQIEFSASKPLNTRNPIAELLISESNLGEKFEIPTENFLALQWKDETAQDLFTMAQTNDKIDIKMTFTGLTEMPVEYKRFEPNTQSGWFEPTVIQEAVSSKDIAQAGFKWGSKPFGQEYTVLNSALISAFPKIEATFPATANLQNIQNIWNSHIEESPIVSVLGLRMPESSTNYAATFTTLRDGGFTMTLESPLSAMLNHAKPETQEAFIMSACVEQIAPDFSTVQEGLRRK